jgi:predicted kinase
MARVLLLTGTCGSGKTTVSALLEQRGWRRISEDDIWSARFGKDRGAFGSDEHRCKRRQVHEAVRAAVRAALAAGRDAVIDATVHESPPEAFEEYRDFFAAHGISWALRVLQPRLEVAVARDAARASWTLGARRVGELRAKFTGAVFGAECFVDNSDETAHETADRMVAIPRAIAWKIYRRTP